jgi:hypothetical protein
MNYLNVLALVAAGSGLFAPLSLADQTGSDIEARAFRARGQAGIEAAIAAGASDALLDRICRQFDCRASRLFWHTELGDALAAAKASGKPVLSLRLLGKLDEELSCANSRFFRTLLYSDPSIARVLRERFILHWGSERPAPRITIEFGDGRKMVQTIAGNSIHYLLDSDGQVLDALPGLYAPSEFRAAIEEFADIFRELGPLRDPEARGRKLAAFHRYRASALEREWARPLPAVAAYDGSKGRSPASAATGLAVTKALVQAPAIRALPPRGDEASAGKGGPLKELMDDPIWESAARGRAAGVRLSPQSEALARSKLQYDPATGMSRSGEEISRALERLKLALVTDGLRNDYVYRRALHSWLSQAGVDRTLEGLNRRVYESLFLTPATDPWLGLKPDGVYTGIRGDGISVTR